MTTDANHSQPPQFSRNERRFFIVLTIVGIALILFFGLRAARSYLRLQRMGLHAGTTDVEAIRGWMTIPYIAKAYNVPEAYLFQQFDIPAQVNRSKSLAQINRTYIAEEPGKVMAVVKTAIMNYQQVRPSSPGAQP